MSPLRALVSTVLLMMLAGTALCATSAPSLIASAPSAHEQSASGQATRDEASLREYELHEKPTLDRLVGWGTAALAGITAFLSVFTFLLWRDGKAAAAANVIDMKESLRISRDAANAARLTVDAMQDAAQKDLRAYVALEELVQKPPRQWMVTVGVRNHGKTPAHQMQINAIVRLQAPDEKSWHNVASSGSQMLHPGQAASGEFGLPAELNPGVRLFAFGKVTYHDIYGRWWATRFDYWQDNEGIFRPQHGGINKEEGPCGSKQELLQPR